jgi:hypothetical protein
MTVYRVFIFAGLIDVQNILSADTGIYRQTEGHSFADHLISELVSVKPSSMFLLCSRADCNALAQPSHLHDFVTLHARLAYCIRSLGYRLRY